MMYVAYHSIQKKLCINIYNYVYERENTRNRWGKL